MFGFFSVGETIEQRKRFIKDKILSEGQKISQAQNFNSEKWQRREEQGQLCDHVVLRNLVGWYNCSRRWWTLTGDKQVAVFFGSEQIAYIQIYLKYETRPASSHNMHMLMFCIGTSVSMQSFT